MKIKVLTSIYEDNHLVEEKDMIEFKPDQDGVEMHVVNLYPQVTYQTFRGFGGALTEAAGYALSNLGEENYQKVVEAYFGKDGIGYCFIRTHIDSCDFSLGNYSAVEDEKDTQFKTFSLIRDEQYVQPLLKRAMKACENDVQIMLSPWSPPAFMKTNGKKNGGGKLKKEHYQTWANYICKYIEEYLACGFPVKMLSIQNEPKAVQTWDSCVFTAAEEKEFLEYYLKPALIKNNLEEIKIIIWDHNKERVFDRALEIIDDKTDSMVDGIGFHWYSGDHFEALNLVREMFPDKDLVFTEGSVEYSRFGASDVVANAEMYAHDMIGNLNAGMNVWLDWNIALDEKGGPNHVGNFCDAPVMCDAENNEVEFKLSFTYISHLSKYIKPGAKRIGFTKYTNKLEMTAFQNTDGTLAVVLLNTTEEEIPITIRMKENIVEITVKKHSIVSGIIEE